VAEIAHLTGRKQRQPGRDQGQDVLKEVAPNDLLPLARSHLPKCPEPPKIAPLAGDQVFST
jgi:hypothetical protein